MTPVASIGAATGKALRTNRKVLVLSQDNAGKQRSHHRDIAAGDYARIQRLLDGGELRSLGKGRFNLLGRFGAAPYVASVKVTNDGDEAYLLSLHKLSSATLAQKRRQGKRVREGKRTPDGYAVPPAGLNPAGL